MPLLLKIIPLNAPKSQLYDSAGRIILIFFETAPKKLRNGGRGLYKKAIGVIFDIFFKRWYPF